jgi:hypothetical protein
MLYGAFAKFERKVGAVAINKTIPQDQNIHISAQKARDCFRGCPDHRFVFIQRCIEYDGHAGFLIEPRN